MSQGEGVVVADPGTTEPPATPDPAATPGETPAPTDTAVALPSDIAGQTAAQETCSNGNVKSDE